MSALTPDQRVRHRELSRQLQAELRRIGELSNGFEFEFPLNTEIHRALTELTPLEHACCPFFTINIHVEPAGDLFWQLTGTEGVKQFIRMEFAGWFA
jgi:hypothetical protein